MQLKLAQNYKVGSKMDVSRFVTEFHYGMRAGQGIPMKCPTTREPVLVRDNAGFRAGLKWGQANRDCRSMLVLQTAIGEAYNAYLCGV